MSMGVMPIEMRLVTGECRGAKPSFLGRRGTKGVEKCC